MDHMPDDAVVAWLESAPPVAKSWLRDRATQYVLLDQRDQAFQLVGRYDGSMSEECKDLFRQQHEFLSRVVAWCQEQKLP